MDNKKLGILLIIICIILGILIFSFNSIIKQQADAECSCEAMEGGMCPHAEQNPWPIYIGFMIAAAILALGIYLIFFEKSQKEIISTLEKQKQIQREEEMFNIFLKALDPFEKKVIKAVKEQDGITQQTLRIRTGLHKSKLSIVLDNLEKKNIISRKLKGKTKQVFLKIKI